MFLLGGFLTELCLYMRTSWFFFRIYHILNNFYYSYLILFFYFCSIILQKNSGLILAHSSNQAKLFKFSLYFEQPFLLPTKNPNVQFAKSVAMNRIIKFVIPFFGKDFNLFKFPYHNFHLFADLTRRTRPDNTRVLFLYFIISSLFCGF